MTELILSNWDKKIGRSRSRLVWDLRIVLEEIRKNVGQSGTEDRTRHAPAPNP